MFEMVATNWLIGLAAAAAGAAISFMSLILLPSYSEFDLTERRKKWKGAPPHSFFGGLLISPIAVPVLGLGAVVMVLGPIIGGVTGIYYIVFFGAEIADMFGRVKRVLAQAIPSASTVKSVRQSLVFRVLFAPVIGVIKLIKATARFLNGTNS